MCHHKAPHRPWQPDEKHRKQWENVQVPEPDTFNDDYATRSDAAREATMRIDRDLTPRDLKQKPPEGLTGPALKKWKYQRYMRDYLACIASVDDNVGRLLDYLDKNGLADNTHRHLHLGPGLFPRRPRLVRQAFHVRGIAADAVSGALAGQGQGGHGERRRWSSTWTSRRR